MIERRCIALEVNGRRVEREVPVRLLLTDFLRGDVGLTGTHVGCEHGVCGCCTILLDGVPVRSCLLFAVQVDGCSVRTVEGLAGGEGRLHPLQEAFRAEHALQCGFCTPGFLMTLVAFLDENPRPSREEIRAALSGNLCRCTGYVNIINAVERYIQGFQVPSSKFQDVDSGTEPPEQTWQGAGSVGIRVDQHRFPRFGSDELPSPLEGEGPGGRGG